MTYYQKSLDRIHMLRGHIHPSKQAINERKNPSFNVAAAKEAFWKTFPAGYFEGYEALSELKGIHARSLYTEELKENQRIDTNKFLIRYLTKIFEKGFTTPK